MSRERSGPRGSTTANTASVEDRMNERAQADMDSRKKDQAEQRREKAQSVERGEKRSLRRPDDSE